MMNSRNTCIHGLKPAFPRPFQKLQKSRVFRGDKKFFFYNAQTPPKICNTKFCRPGALTRCPISSTPRSRRREEVDQSHPIPSSILHCKPATEFTQKPFWRTQFGLAQILQTDSHYRHGLFARPPDAVRISCLVLNGRRRWGARLRTSAQHGSAHPADRAVGWRPDIHAPARPARPGRIH